MVRWNTDAVVLADSASNAARRAEAVALARRSDVAILVLATGTPTVLVLQNGRPAAIPGVVESVPAILEVRCPGHGRALRPFPGRPRGCPRGVER